MPNEGTLARNLDLESCRAALKTVISELISNFNLQQVLDENNKFYTNNILRPWHTKKSGNSKDGNKIYVTREVISLVVVTFMISRKEDGELKKAYIEDLGKLCYSAEQFEMLLDGFKKAGDEYAENLEITKISDLHEEFENIIYELLEVPEKHRIGSTEAEMLYDDFYDFLDGPQLPGLANLLMEEMYKLRNRLLIEANGDLTDPEIDKVDQETLEIVNFVRNRLEELGIK